MKQTDITYAQACKLVPDIGHLPANAESDRTC